MEPTFGPFGVFPKDIWELLFSRYFHCIDAIRITAVLNCSFRSIAKNIQTRLDKRRLPGESLSSIYPSRLTAPGLSFIRAITFRKNFKQMVLLRGKDLTHFEVLLFDSLKNSISSSFQLPEKERFLDVAVTYRSTSEYLLIPNFFGGCILVLNMSGEEIRRFGSKGLDPHQIHGPRSIACTQNDEIIVTGRYVQIWSLAGEVLRVFGVRGELFLPTAASLLEDSSLLIVTDSSMRRVIVLENSDAAAQREPRGIVRRWNHSSFITPTALEIDGDQRLYVADHGANVGIHVFKLSGEHVCQFAQDKLPFKMKMRMDGKLFVVADDGVWIY